MARRLTPYERLLRAVPESDLQDQCRRVAELLHAPYYHDQDSRKNPRGLPDTILVVPPVLCLWELKKESEQPKAEQRRWGEALAQCSVVDYRLIRPSNIGEAWAWLLRTTGKGDAP